MGHRRWGIWTLSPDKAKVRMHEQKNEGKDEQTDERARTHTGEKERGIDGLEE